MYLTNGKSYENKYILTNLNNVININSLVASIRASNGTMEKNLTYFHNFWQFLYCKSGECSWTIDGKLCVMKADDFIITPPHTVRKYENSVDGTTMHFISFFSNSNKLKDMQKELIHLSPKLKVKLISAIRDIDKHFIKNAIYLFPAEKTTDIDLQRIKCKLERFLLDLYSAQFSSLNNTSKPNPSASHDEHLALAIAYMQKNINRNLTISEIAKATGIGRTTLENIFQKNESVGVKAYFTQMKIDAAKEMILQNNYSMTMISQELGFSSVHNFSRTFKNLTGVSPKKYQSYF